MGTVKGEIVVVIGHLGIFGWFGFAMEVPERAALIAEAGFSATSLWWGPESIAYTQQRHHDAPRQVRDLGLAIDNVHVSYRRANDLWSEDERIRQDVVDDHLRWLDDCARHDIPMMVMHKSKGRGKTPPNRQGLKSMRTVVERAEELGIVVAVENTRRQDYLAFLFEEIDSPCLGFCYDSSHDWIIAGDNAGRLLEQFGSRLVTTHLSDNDGLRDRHWLPGEGVVDWERIVQVFPRAYEGNLFLEVLPMACQRIMEPRDFVHLAYERLSWIKQLIDTSRGQSA